MPKWVNSERKIYLSQVLASHFNTLKGWNLDLTTGEIYNDEYNDYIQRLIKTWVEADREEANALWKRERKALHSLNEKRLPLRGRFNNVSSVIWHEQQPIYYLESIGMNGLTCKPFAKVKMASSYYHLYIDLGDCLKSISKNRKRKAIRYHKPLPQSVDELINDKIANAVKHYLS
jgi:hypothetical protein